MIEREVKLLYASPADARLAILAAGAAPLRCRRFQGQLCRVENSRNRLEDLVDMRCDHLMLDLFPVFEALEAAL